MSSSLLLRKIEEQFQGRFFFVSFSVSSFIPTINSIGYLMWNWQGSQFASNATFSSANSAKTLLVNVLVLVCIQTSRPEFLCELGKGSVLRLMINESKNTISKLYFMWGFSSYMKQMISNNGFWKIHNFPGDQDNSYL